MFTKLPLFAIVALISCSDDPTSAPPDAAESDPGAAARDRFRTAFETQRFAELPSIIAELEAANAADPQQPDTVLLLGLANLWGAAEVGRDPSQIDQIPTRMTQVIQHMSEMQALRPDDHRVSGWLGVTIMNVAEQTQNPAMFEQGRAILAAGVEAFPEFNLFINALANQGFPVGSPEFASAVDGYHRTVQLCFGAVSRDNPDVTPFLDKETQVGPERVCWNDPSAVHNFEGYFLSMGDTLVKAGELSAARRAYQNTTLLANNASWPYRQLADDRLATIETRAALYADADPSNDPLLIGQTEHQCASCHARE